MGKINVKKWGRMAIAAGLLAVTAAVPAGATPDDGDGHTIQICHATNSETNDFVVITVDVAAFDYLGSNDHGLHTTRDGQRDHVFDGSCGDVDVD